MKSKLLDRLLEIIKDNELSVRSVEMDAGITEGYIHKAKHTERSISADRLSAMYKVLKLKSNYRISPEWLLTGHGNKHGSYKKVDKEPDRVNELLHSYGFQSQLLSALDDDEIQEKIKAIVTQK